MWCNWNGNIVEQISFNQVNRSFKYGDGLFESMRVFNGKIFNRLAHESRLFFGLETLKMSLKKPLSTIFNEVEELLLKNNIDKGGFARLTLFRDSKGAYAPDSNQAAYLIECMSNESNQFELKENEIETVFFMDYKKPISKLSNIKSNNALLYVLASIYAKEQGVDDAFLINENNHIIESTNGNIFLQKEGELITPPLNDGSLDGTLRKLILQYFKVEERSISKQDIECAEEVFLTNAHGIRWMKSNSKSKEIVQKLNSLI